MKIRLDNVMVPFDDLAQIHEDICVCWDRDGIEEIIAGEIAKARSLASIGSAPGMRIDEGDLHVWSTGGRAGWQGYLTVGGTGHLAALLAGNLLVAYFVCDPVPHWRAPLVGKEVAW